jgi:hypothetical protein
MPKDKEQSPRELWIAEEKLKEEQARINAAKAPSAAYDGHAQTEEAEATSDWQNLSLIGQGRFPDMLALKFDLSWEQRRACIARCIGWTVEKISLASGRSRNTISAWLNKETAKKFIEAFEYHNGSRDTKELIDKEVYSSLQVLLNLRDNPTVSASTRADIAWKFIEQKYGKAKESKEIKGVSLRDLTEELRKSTASEFELALESQAKVVKNDENLN